MKNAGLRRRFSFLLASFVASACLLCRLSLTPSITTGEPKFFAAMLQPLVDEFSKHQRSGHAELVPELTRLDDGKQV
jgi:hypothetical protein